MENRSPALDEAAVQDEAMENQSPAQDEAAVQDEAELVRAEFQFVVNTLISMRTLAGADLIAARNLVKAIYDGMAEDEFDNWDQIEVQRIKRKLARRPTPPRIEYLIRYFMQFLD